MGYFHQKPVLARIPGPLVATPLAEIKHSRHPAIDYQKRIRRALLDAGATQFDCPVAVVITYSCPKNQRGGVTSVMRTVRAAIENSILGPESAVADCQISIREAAAPLLEVGLVPLSDREIAVAQFCERREIESAPHGMSSSQVPSS